MLVHRPFPGVDQLLDAAGRIWSELQPEAWLEAFRHHPAIGSSKAKEKQSATGRRWSSGEQSVRRKASGEDVISAGRRRTR